MAEPFEPAPDQYSVEIAEGLSRALAEAEERELPLESARLIIFSDQHKGARDGADDFQRCERAYNAALAYYLETGHSLVVLGDAEELWECEIKEVMRAYRDTLALEAEFHRRGRYERMWGNHDSQWSKPRNAKRHLHPFFPGLRLREALKLRVTRAGVPLGLLFLAHGHQGTKDSDRFAWFSRLAVRHLWRRAQIGLGVASATPALDWELRERHDRAMFEWARAAPAKPVLITGHTHRPVFGEGRPEPELPRPGEEVERELGALGNEREDSERAAALKAELEWARAERRRVATQRPTPVTPRCYFNTGCCSFGDGDITGLEIAEGEIRLVRWPDGAGRPLPLVLEHYPLDEVLEEVNGASAP